MGRHAMVPAALLLAGLGSAEAAAPCGFGPTDWCPAPAGDPCGRHRTAEECKADKACFGMAYRGESVIACRFDERGFAGNCPTVGCTSEKPGSKAKTDGATPPAN